MANNTIDTRLYHKTLNKVVATLASAGTDNSATKLVVYFDRNLQNGSGVEFTDGANMKAYFAYDGTAGNYTSATYSSLYRTITFVFTSAENTKKLTVVNNSIYDSNGIEFGNNGVDYFVYDTSAKWTKSNTTDIGFIEIDDVFEIGDIGGKKSKIDTTNLKDTAKTNIFGVKDPGDLPIKFYFNNGENENFRVLRSYSENLTLIYLQIRLNEGTWFELETYINIMADSNQVDKALNFTIECALQSIVVSNY